MEFNDYKQEAVEIVQNLTEDETLIAYKLTDDGTVTVIQINSSDALKAELLTTELQRMVNDYEEGEE